ncbi:MAG: DUF615 domain-containing protein [Pseudomonadales bacterium]|nr:DUF615 domain-containing protein [Pseudomonadales bacterium]
MKKDNTDGDIGIPSKSRRKREHQQLQLLAGSLSTLPERQFRKLALNERIREELLLLRSMSASSARNRQIRRVAKLLEDENVAELQSPGEALDAVKRAATARHHRAERLRERLLAADGSVFEELAPNTPEPVLVQLRELCAVANGLGGGTRSRKAYRDIYRLLLESSAPGSGT